MWSKELENRIVAHEQKILEILEYAQQFLSIENQQITIEEMSKAITKHIRQRFPDNEESNKAKVFIANYYKDLPKMIEEYRQEDIEIEKLKIQENAEKAPLPENPILVKLAQSKNAVITKWKYGKYKCRSLPTFVFEYGKHANNISPSLIREYLISENTGKPFANRTIDNAIYREGPNRKKKSP